jgi:Predicted membrane protein
MRQLVGWTRYAVIVPAIAAMLGALVLMGQGSFAIVMVIVDAVTNQLSLKESIVDTLTAVDAILLGTVLLVIGYGLYELFIDTGIDVPSWLEIRDLDDLKSKLIGVVVAIIGVVFVGDLVDAQARDGILGLGIGAGAVIIGLAVFAWATKKPGPTTPRGTKKSS